MSSKSTAPTSSPAEDSAHRRASGRVRKPTAKAQALDGGKTYSPPLSDTIVVSSPSVPRHRPHRREPSTTPGTITETSQEASLEPPTPETPAVGRVNGTTPPPKAEDGQDEVEIAATKSSPRRVSRRERKPTAKVLSTSPTAHKRPAPPADAQEAPPRKSARISYSGAKVPSKLRYSISSSHNEPDDAEQVDIIDTPPSKKSKVVVLKTTPTKADDAREAEIPETPIQRKSKVVVLKSKRLSEILEPSRRRRVDDSGSKAPRRRSRRHPKPDQAASANTVVARDEPRAEASCGLSCLPPWSRLLAFAEIAKLMPDSNDEEEVVPGGAQDWRSYTKNWCQCNNLPPLPTHHHQVNTNELARALLPNTVSRGTKLDPIDLTEPAAAETQLLSQPVNTILRATDAEKLSKLFTSPTNVDATRGRYATPATGSLRTASDFGTLASNGSVQRRLGVNEYANGLYQQPMPSSEPAKRTYEERLRDDHKALTDIRKRASAQGIAWSFNMTFDDIHALLMEVEDRQQEQEWHYHPQAAGPDHGMHGHEYQVGESNGSPSGFGLLLPARATPTVQPPTKSTRKRQRDSWINYSSTNGTPEISQRLESPNAVSFVEDYDPATSQPRRLSSPSRPKSSRFRVDPRGLLGESPGPGTIINIDDRKNGAGRASRRSRGY
ncbi:hypothetical protein A1O3_08868 [Capronia epimyces CBS 606.96]|uniref:Uncharacterized protein n=1 Tax=Capronia epimyces CBS 606.96 TaxID=1182542 RepID=W9XQY8_9EURO|nr:uncharacterized protein A1O3_08868 [Capronia epimyces CBS 606.96]EXJ79366.1 hypothetical protein A1O3_08868 [Capronia epimyces CBS 606.96]